MLNKLKAVLKFAAITFLIVFIGLELFILGLRLIKGEQAIAELPVYIIRVTSDSMYPTLREGDCVFSADVPFDQLKVGDLITFSFADTLVTHEIIKVNDNGTVTTKGSMNEYDDGNISPSHYMGKVLFKLPFLSVFLNITELPVQKVMFIGLIIVLFFGYPIGMWSMKQFTKKK